MGFSEDQATIALLQSNGDLGRAINLLLEQPQAAAPAPPPSRSAVEQLAERQLQQALEASRREVEEQARRAAVSSGPPPARTAAAAPRPAASAPKAPAPAPAAAAPPAAPPAKAPAVATKPLTAPQKAALAAAEARLKGAPPTTFGMPASAASGPAFGGARASAFAPHQPPPEAAKPIGGGGASTTTSVATAAAATTPAAPPSQPHAQPPQRSLLPQRSLPPMGAAGSPEERVRQCAARLAGRAEAVDVLVASLGRVLQHPDNEKYRKVNPSNPAFARTVGAAPGGVDFLIAVGYEPLHGHLVLQARDPALLWLGKSMLESVRNTEAYLGSKESIEIEKALGMSAVAYDAEDERRRAAFASRVPPEPAEGSAGSAKVCVHVGASSTWRRFNSADTLEDVLNFVRSLPGVPPVASTHELRVADVTTRPAKRLDPSTQLGLTLQTLDLWPTGHVRCRVNGSDEAYDEAMMAAMDIN